MYILLIFTEYIIYLLTEINHFYLCNDHDDNLNNKSVYMHYIIIENSFFFLFSLLITKMINCNFMMIQIYYCKNKKKKIIILISYFDKISYIYMCIYKHDLLPEKIISIYCIHSTLYIYIYICIIMYR